MFDRTHRRGFVQAFSALFVALVSSPEGVIAASHLSKPIRLIVPFSSNGPTDTIERWLGLIAPAGAPRNIMAKLIQTAPSKTE